MGIALLVQLRIKFSLSPEDVLVICCAELKGGNLAPRNASLCSRNFRIDSELTTLLNKQLKRDSTV